MWMQFESIRAQGDHGDLHLHDDESRDRLTSYEFTSEAA
jgi:hypothetical protein